MLFDYESIESACDTVSATIAAGIVPAVLHYYAKLCVGASPAGVRRFLLTAGAIGLLYKRNASISGA